MRPVFIFEGIPSTDYDIRAFPDNSSMDAPERNVDVVEIPGRNGELTIDRRSYKNRSLDIKCICDHYKKNYPAFRAWMLSNPAMYRRLEYAQDADVFFMARCTGVKTNKVLRDTAEFTVSFSCKPQKFLKSGEIPVELTSSGAIFNPTRFPSKPLLEVTGAGTITIDGKLIQINRNEAGMTIDTEIMEAYHDSTWLNSDVVLPDEFELSGGQCSIGLSSGITSLKITPRWWTL